MKKILFALFMGLMVCGVAFAAYDEGSYVNTKATSGGTAAEPYRVYKIVRNPLVVDASTVYHVMSAGDVVVWDVISDDGVTVNIIGVSGSTDSVAGIVVGTIPTPDSTGTAAQSVGRRNWGYICVEGGPITAHVNSAAAVGCALTPMVASPRNLTVALDNNNAGAARLNVNACAFAYDTESAFNNDAEVFVKNIR